MCRLGGRVEGKLSWRSGGQPSFYAFEYKSYVSRREFTLRCINESEEASGKGRRRRKAEAGPEQRVYWVVAERLTPRD
jgi:hypothetical protein